MKKIVFVVALVAMGAILAPASGDTEVNSCATTSAATVSPVIGATAPECTYIITCTGTAAGCAYLVTVDSNGTGLVEGHMSVEVVSNTGEATFVNVRKNKEAPDPSCSGLFECHYASTKQNPVVLFLTGGVGEGIAALVSCYGGGISAVETVSCNSVSVEFEPR